jgi:hypothetical protein
VTPCLRPDEVVDLVDGVLDPVRGTHAETCAACREAVAGFRAALADLAITEVPEPSPYFWATVNRRVLSAIGDRPARGGWRAWFAWDTLVPVAGMAAVLMALGGAIARPPAPLVIAVPSPHADATPAVTVDVAADAADDALTLVVELAGTLPDASGVGLDLAPLPDLGDVAAAALTDDELDALEGILRAAVDRPKS